METKGIVEAVRNDGNGLKLDDGEWYSSFNEKVNCKKGDEVKIIYTDNTKDNRTYHNFTKIEITKSIPQDQFEKARESKDASQLTSYAKDLVIAIIGKDVPKEVRKVEVNLIMQEAAQAVADAYNQIKEIISGEKVKVIKPEQM